MPQLMDELTDRSLVTSLRSTVCPSCGGRKNAAQTFCGPEYFKLPQLMRRALYARLGSGYREAVYEALTLLGAETFKLPDSAEG